MSINSIENAERYASELDKMFEQKSAVGFFSDNALATKFVGAKTVIVPDIDFQGLTDYDRDSGFARGAINVTNNSYTMAMDRARSLQIDREDLDETGVANLAGKILGEYVRTKVVPECDAYVLSKLANLAITRSNTITGDLTKPFESLLKLICNVQAKVGYDEELVAFVDSYMYASIQNSSELSRMLTVSDFKQGEVNLKVQSLNGVALIPVVSERMKTEYDFDDGTTGGFAPTDEAREIYMMVCPKSGAHLVKKTENMRIFTPGQNIDADAYKFDYRIYYDVFVKKSGLDAIWVWASPEIAFSNVSADKNLTYGSIGANENISVTATAAAGGTITYQWYMYTGNLKSAASKVSGATTNTYTIPQATAKGVYKYFLRCTIDGVTFNDSPVIKVTVA